MMGRWTSLLQTLYITPRREVFLRCSKASHPSESSIRCTLKVLWYRFSTNRAARLWTASNLSMLFWVYGSRTDEAYSSMGLTKAFVCSVLYGAGANLLIALQKTKSPVCLVCHIVDVVVPVQSCCMVMPRYLALETESRVWPCNSYE